MSSRELFGAAKRARKRAAPRKASVPSEDMESSVFAAWLDSQPGVEVFSHLPLETPTDVIQQARLMRMGVRSGVPDYLLVVAGKIVFVEMKRRNGRGRTSAAQERWLQVLNAAGAVAVVCEGFHEAKAVVQNLLDA